MSGSAIKETTNHSMSTLPSYVNWQEIVTSMTSNRLRRRVLRENDKSLADILTLGRSLELSDRQANKIESEQKHDVHRVFEKRGNKTQKTEQKWQRHSQMPPNSKTCEKSRHKSQHLRFNVLSK